MDFRVQAEEDFRKLMDKSKEDLHQYEAELVEFCSDIIEKLYHKRTYSLKHASIDEVELKLEEIWSLEREIIRSYCIKLEKYQEAFLKGIMQTRIATLSLLFIHCHY